MPAQHLEADDPLVNKARRIETSLITLNARIARLLLALGVSLDTEAEMNRILNLEQATLQRLTGDHATETSNPQTNRLRHEWEELRALLVMRCDLMKQTLDELGLEATREITCQVEAQLEREGFRPGADGFNLYRRLNASRNTPDGI